MAIERKRCTWPGNDPLYVAYHDLEWGVPVHDDRLLFEFLVLEGSQAGLSWETILKKRENYRPAFDRFDHDLEWGVPVHDDRLLFEFLVLEGSQAGLSWETILKKRENYRSAFDRFD